MKRNYRDHNQGNQEYDSVQQVIPSTNPTSAIEKSQSRIEATTVAAAGRVHPLCRRAAEGGPQKQKMLQEAQLARLAPHPETRLLLLIERHKV